MQQRNNQLLLHRLQGKISNPSSFHHWSSFLPFDVDFVCYSDLSKTNLLRNQKPLCVLCFVTLHLLPCCLFLCQDMQSWYHQALQFSLMWLFVTKSSLLSVSRISRSFCSNFFSDAHCPEVSVSFGNTVLLQESHMFRPSTIASY